MFDPINKAHAIAEAVVFFEFAPDLKDVLPALLELREELKDKLPKSETMQSMQVNFGDNQQVNVVPLPSGVKLSRFKRDGSLEYQLNVTPTSISFHCTDYTRWDEVWSELRSMIVVVYKLIGAAPISLSSVGIKYVDRFTWRGADKDYSASELFQKNSVYLHGAAFSSGSRWHCHTGWFKRHANSEVLNQLNVDSGINFVEGKSTIIVTIDHTQIMRSNQPGELNAYAGVPAEQGKLDNLMKELHSENKNILLSLLTEDMAKRIGLKHQPKPAKIFR